MNFGTTHFMPRSCVKILDTAVFGTPRSASSSHTVSRQSWLIAALHIHSLRCSACCRPSRMWITFHRFLTVFEVFVPRFYLYCTHCIVPESLLNYLSSFHGGTFKLNTKFDADLFSACTVILKVMATQCTSMRILFNSVYCPH